MKLFVLILSICCFQLCVDGQSINWAKPVVNNKFYFTEKVALFELRNHFKSSNQAFIKLHSRKENNVSFEILPINVHLLGKPNYPVNDYFSFMRIYTASREELDFIWSLPHNDSLTTSVPILSFANEFSVLQHSSDYLFELSRLLKAVTQNDNDTKRKRYLVQLHITIKIFLRILIHTESTYVPYLLSIQELQVT
jgi:hypothetical protein